MIKHKALRMIMKGEAVPCGSGCYQTDPFTTGTNEFLGPLPTQARIELADLYISGKIDNKPALIEAMRYSGMLRDDQ